jgi:hypothetical protein
MDWVTPLVSGTTAAIVSGLLAKNTKIGEFRQTWINDLRKDIAEYMSKAEELLTHYVEQNDTIDQDKKKELIKTYEKLRYGVLEVFRRIQMRINPEDDNPFKHEEEKFLEDLGKFRDINNFGLSNTQAEWSKLADHTILEARRLLKREWEVIKGPTWRMRLKTLQAKFCKTCGRNCRKLIAILIPVLIMVIGVDFSIKGWSIAFYKGDEKSLSEFGALIAAYGTLFALYDGKEVASKFRDFVAQYDAEKAVRESGIIVTPKDIAKIAPEIKKRIDSIVKPIIQAEEWWFIRMGVYTIVAGTLINGFGERTMHYLLALH